MWYAVVDATTRRIVGLEGVQPVGQAPTGSEYVQLSDEVVKQFLPQPGKKFLKPDGTVEVVPPTPEEMALPAPMPAPAIAVLTDGKAAIEQSSDFSAGQKALLGPLFDGLIQSLSGG
jgi:hypothetical protein